MNMTPISAADRVVLLLSIVPYLLEHGSVSVESLSEQFRVSQAEVRKLVRTIGTAGVPGETRTYQHEDLFDIDWTAFEERDTVTLISAVAINNTPRFSPPELAALLAGLHLLKETLPDHLSQVAQNAAEKLATLTGGETTDALPVSVSTEPISDTVRLLSRGAQEQRRVHFTYAARTGERSARRVEPVLVTQEGGSWYLRGYCLTRNAMRIFRVEAISDLTLTDAPATQLGTMQPQKDDVARWFGTEGTFTVRNELLYLTQRWEPRIVETKPDGWTVVTVSLVSEESAIEFVSLAPGAIQAVSPEPVREAVRQWALQQLNSQSNSLSGY